MKLDNKEIAEMFRELGIVLEILGENPFKIRAYKNAANIIEELRDDLRELARNGQLTKIDGIGKAIAKKIDAIIETGKLPKLEEVKKSIPPGLSEMLKIPELTPRRINLIWKRLGITTIHELREACRKNKLLEIPGFDEKSQQELIQRIESAKY